MVHVKLKRKSVEQKGTPAGAGGLIPPFHTLKEEKNVMQLYRDLAGLGAEAFLNCFRPCEKACRHGILNRPLLTMAHPDPGMPETE